MDVFIMTEFDIEQVKQIEEDCGTSPWSLLDYKNEIKREDGLGFVIKEQNQIIGFILARLITNQNILSSGSNSKYLKSEIEIYNLAVKPSHQNKGVGKRLIKQIITQTAALQSRVIWLEVRESNIKAIRFYKKNRFKKISKRKNYYTDPKEDGIVMRRSAKDF